ncbi:MAG: hypothetical protein K5656_03330 [Lachnospiraceae bacterium]|nr:hypothetical protein [Lachnospiraceae bacterium]
MSKKINNNLIKLTDVEDINNIHWFTSLKQIEEYFNKEKQRTSIEYAMLKNKSIKLGEYEWTISVEDAGDVMYKYIN